MNRSSRPAVLVAAAVLVLGPASHALAEADPAAPDPAAAVEQALQPATDAASGAVAGATEPLTGVERVVEELSATASEAPDDGRAPEPQRQEQAPATQDPTAAEDPASDERSAEVHAASEELGAVVCLRVPGGSAPAEADLVVLDEDVFGQLRDAEPALAGLVAECPEGARTVDNGLTVDLDGGDAGSVCLRLDADADDPLAADVVVFDENVVDALTEAGLPLRDLVVPCPAVLAAGAGAGGGGGGDAASRVPSGVDSGRLPYTGGPLGVLAATGLLVTAGGGLLYRLGCAAGDPAAAAPAGHGARKRRTRRMRLRNHTVRAPPMYSRTRASSQRPYSAWSVRS